MQHVLEQRHKLSLERFSKKRDWIEAKISQLEATVLPAFDDLDGVLEDVQLAAAWKQHDDIDKEANELDQGELRSLRLLAKAASQKALNAEDTDLIEITLTTLFALDKLLHLLRQRSKALRLVDARILWNNQIAKVEKDYDALLHQYLPQFLAKARWKAPKESSKPRASDGLAASLGRPQGSTSSQMARQMRSEIVTLDLAAFTSRVHTLQYSTLPTTGKTLDSIIDSSPAPIPDRYLDLQDDLEARVKSGILGVTDFCSQLAKQWKQADEIWSTSVDEGNAAEALKREVDEAALKSPTSHLADAFEARFVTSATKCASLADVLAKLATPTHAQHCLDQARCTQDLAATLTGHCTGLMNKQAAAKEATESYRAAVTALTDARELQSALSGANRDIAARIAAIPPIQVDTGLLQQSDGLPAPDARLADLAQLVHSTETGPLQRAPAVMQALQKGGIDPNVRRDLQDSMLNIAATLRAARDLLAQQEDASRLRQDAIDLASSLRSRAELWQGDLSQLQQQILDSCWVPAAGDNSSVALDSRMPEFESQSVLKDLQNRLEAIKSAGDQVVQTNTQRFLLGRLASLQELAEQITKHRAGLEAVIAQKRAAQSAENEYTGVSQGMDELAAELRGLSINELQEERVRNLGQRARSLASRQSMFIRNTAAAVSQVSPPPGSCEVSMAATNLSLKDHINGLVVQLNGKGADVQDLLDAVQSAEGSRSQLQRLRSQRETSALTLAELVEGASEDRLSNLTSLRSAISALVAETLTFAIPPAIRTSGTPVFIELDRMRCDVLAEAEALSRETDEAVALVQQEIAAAEAKRAEEAKEVEVARQAAEEDVRLRTELDELERDSHAAIEAQEAAARSFTAFEQELAEVVWTGQDDALMESYESRASSVSSHLAAAAADVQHVQQSLHRALATTEPLPKETSDSHRRARAMIDKLAGSTSEPSSSTAPSARALQEAKGRKLKAEESLRLRAKEEAKAVIEMRLSDLLREQETNRKEHEALLASLQARVSECTTADAIEVLAEGVRQHKAAHQAVKNTAEVDDLRRRLEEYGSSSLASVHDEHKDKARAVQKEGDELLLCLERQIAERSAAEIAELAAAEARRTADDRERELHQQKKALDATLARVASLQAEAQELASQPISQSEAFSSREPDTGTPASFGERLARLRAELDSIAIELQYSAELSLDQGTDTISIAQTAVKALQEEVDRLDIRLAATFSEHGSSQANQATHARSRQASEDVFGPEIYTSDLSASIGSLTASPDVTAPDAPSPEPYHKQSEDLEEIKSAIEGIDLSFWLANAQSPKGRLPTQREAQAAQRQISLAHAQLDDMSLPEERSQATSRLQEVQLLLAQRSEDVARVAALADFGASADECDAAISHLLDALDEQENDIAPGSMEAADSTIQKARMRAAALLDDARVSHKMKQLEQVWADLKALIERGESDTSSISQPRSRSGSVTSQTSFTSLKRVSSRVSLKPATSRIPSVSIPRVSSSASLSRIPTAGTPRNRKVSTASVASTSSASRLPVRASPALTGHFLAPRSVTHKASRDFNRSAGPSTPLSRQSSLSQVENLTPPGSRRSSNRRSSGAKAADVNDRPNNYRANSKRKLDVAVGNIVNTMNVPVSVTPAEAFQDLTGKYWIGDPPKLYYARILRSKTVMLRVGGGWQELGSFLTTHYDAVFSAQPPPTPFRQSMRDSPGDQADRSWTDTEGLKASLPTYAPSGPFASPRKPEDATPRAVSHHAHSMRRNFSTSTRNGGPLDLTALLVKSTSRSPPVAGSNTQARSKSASIPWRF